ncbi:HAD family hydrolase [Anaeromicropila herbilytica]|uniref:Haloacid dehalogenase n=1 Tax=Anaeromicropila herbilytica TaxID=2785025 RepID=A0A7R7EHD9_9FIRM|nr:HAD family phosphatase [Anaeromicropila herbilytica]BCN28779.1 haloacid dehalogenase [Anaeromicropila herbilytica]
MIRNIVFDIGNVLTHFRWKEYLEELNFTKEIRDHVANATVKHAIWNEFDRGVREDEDIIRECISHAPEYEKEVQLFFDNITRIVTEYDYAAPLIKSLKDLGYKVYLLSNYPKTPFQYAMKNFSFFPFIDGKVISYEVKQIKPQAEIYHTLLNQYDLAPTETVFIDDKLENVEAANKIGIHTIHFSTLEDMKEKLNALEVPVM